MKQQQRMKIMNDLTKKIRSKGRVDAENRWRVAELVAESVDTSRMGNTIQKWYVWSEKMKKTEQMEVRHQQKVVQMIKSAEGSAGLLHKITKPTAWRGGTQILKKEEYARLLDRCEAKRKEWAKQWQCDENVQILEEIGGSAAKDKGV